MRHPHECPFVESDPEIDYCYIDEDVDCPDRFEFPTKCPLKKADEAIGILSKTDVI